MIGGEPRQARLASCKQLTQTPFICTHSGHEASRQPGLCFIRRSSWAVPAVPLLHSFISDCRAPTVSSLRSSVQQESTRKSKRSFYPADSERWPQHPSACEMYIHRPRNHLLLQSPVIPSTMLGCMPWGWARSSPWAAAVASWPSTAEGRSNERDT